MLAPPSPIPDLYYCLQGEVRKILAHPTKQDQNRRVLGVLVGREPHIAHQIIQVICNRQAIFSELLKIPGLQDYISRFQERELGKQVCRALKYLHQDPNAGSSNTPTYPPI